MYGMHMSVCVHMHVKSVRARVSVHVYVSLCEEINTLFQPLHKTSTWTFPLPYQQTYYVNDVI